MEKRIVLTLIQTGDLWLRNGGFNNCRLTHHATVTRPRKGSAEFAIAPRITDPKE